MLTWISWMAWSGFCQMHLVWKQAGCAGIIGPGFWLDATGPVPVFHFQTQSHFVTQHPGSYCTKPAVSVSSLGQMDLVQKQGGVQQSSDLLLANTSELIWTGCETDLARLLGLMLCGAWTVGNWAGCAMTVWVWHLSGRWQALCHGQRHVMSKWQGKG